MTVSTRYQHTGLVLVRATTDPGDLDLPTHLNLSDPAAIEQEGRVWLTKVWARTEVREALRLASPAFGARIDQLLDDGAGPDSVKEMRRAIISVASYLLRWQRRVTPFGMFAGVGTAAVGPATADVGTGHRAVVRADAEWLTTLIDRFERHPGLRPQLMVVADSAGIVRDGRVIVARRAEVGVSTPGPPRESSVRLNRPVQFALAAAGSPIRFDALAAQMTARFSSASSGPVHGPADELPDAMYTTPVTEQHGRRLAHEVTDEEMPRSWVPGRCPQALRGQVFVPAPLDVPPGRPCPACAGAQEARRKGLPGTAVEMNIIRPRIRARPQCGSLAALPAAAPAASPGWARGSCIYPAWASSANHSQSSCLGQSA